MTKAQIIRRIKGIIVIAALLGAAWMLNRIVPNEHLPWRKLDSERPIGMATKGQILRLSVSPSNVCMTLARDIKTFQSIPSEPKEANAPCGWDVARLVYGHGEAVLAPGEANMQCPLSVATYLWLREVDAVALRRFDQPLAKIHHMGSYSCRKQRGNGSGQWSEHAFANAWDISGFELADGTLITVLNGWNSKDKQERKFLRDVQKQACRIFNTTLSPDYNAAHRDHFHVDMGPYATCR